MICVYKKNPIFKNNYIISSKQLYRIIYKTMFEYFNHFLIKGYLKLNFKRLN